MKHNPKHAAAETLKNRQAETLAELRHALTGKINPGPGRRRAA